MLWDASHLKVEHYHPVLLVADGTLSIFASVQGAKQSLGDYLTMFHAHVEQVSKAHEERPWRHSKFVVTAMAESRLSGAPVADPAAVAEKAVDKPPLPRARDEGGGLGGRAAGRARGDAGRPVRRTAGRSDGWRGRRFWFLVFGFSGGGSSKGRLWGPMLL